VPRVSLKVRPTIPTAAQALRHDERNPSSVHGLLSVLAKISVLRFVCNVEHGPEGFADWNADAAPSLRLPQPDMRPVLCGPWQSQQIALPLAGPERQQQR
jgi:hypothetical protein